MRLGAFLISPDGRVYEINQRTHAGWMRSHPTLFPGLDMRVDPDRDTSLESEAVRRGWIRGQRSDGIAVETQRRDGATLGRIQDYLLQNSVYYLARVVWDVNDPPGSFVATVGDITSSSPDDLEAFKVARRGPGTTVKKPQDLNDALKLKAPRGFHTREDGGLEPAPVLQTGDGLDDLAKLGIRVRERVPGSLDEFLGKGNILNPDGTVDLYHATTRDRAVEIVREGVLRTAKGAPDTYGIYLSSDPSVADDYGDGTLVKVRVPFSDVSINDVYPGKRVDFQVNSRRGVYRPLSVELYNSSGGDAVKLGGVQRYRMTLPNLLNRDWSSRPYYVEDWFASPARLGRRLGGTTVQATPATIMVDFDDLHVLRLAHHALQQECRMDPRDIHVKTARVAFSTLYKQAQKVQGLRWRIFGDMELPDPGDVDKAVEAVSAPVQWDGATVADLTIDPTDDGAYEFSCVVAVDQEIDGDAAVKVAAKALEDVLRRAGVAFDKISAVKSLAFKGTIKGASMEKSADLKLLFGDKIERPTKLRDARDADIFNPDFEPFVFEDMTVRPERRRDLRVDPRQRQELQRGGWGPGEEVPQELLPFVEKAKAAKDFNAFVASIAPPGEYAAVYRNPLADYWRERYLKPLEEIPHKEPANLNPMTFESNLDGILDYTGEYTREQLGDMSVREKSVIVNGEEWTAAYADALKHGLIQFIMDFYEQAKSKAGGRGSIAPAFDEVTNVNGGYGDSRLDPEAQALKQEFDQSPEVPVDQIKRGDYIVTGHYGVLLVQKIRNLPGGGYRFDTLNPISGQPEVEEWRPAEWRSSGYQVVPKELVDRALVWKNTKRGEAEGTMDKQAAMFTEIEDGPHGQTARTETPKLDAYKFLAHWAQDGRHYQLVVNEDGSYTCNVDGVHPMTFAPMTGKRASLRKQGADEPDLIFDDSDIDTVDPDTGEEKSPEEMSDDAAFLWDDFVSGLSALIARVSPSGQWFATGRNMGWRKQSGEHSFSLRDPADANEFLRHILPKTQEFTIRVWDGGNVLEMVVSHHDAPTGEGYTLYPVNLESKLTDEIDRLNQHRTRYQASIGADPDVVEVLFLELDPNAKTFFTFEDNGDDGVYCTIVESNLQDPEFVDAVKRTIEGDFFRSPGDFESQLDQVYENSTEEIPENEALSGVTASLRELGAVELQPWRYQKDYAGDDFTGYLMGPGVHRDSDAWEKSNFDNALEMLGGEGSGEVPNPDDPNDPLPAVVVEHAGHFAVGWIENILVHQDAADKVAILQDIMDRLEQYPLLNEDDVSTREYEEVVEAFGNYGAADFRKEMNMDEFYDEEFPLLKPDTQMKIHDAAERAWMESSEHGGHEIHTDYGEAEKRFLKLLQEDKIDFISLDDGTPVGVWGESDLNQLTQDYGDDLDLSHPPQYVHPGQLNLPFDQTAQAGNMDKMSVVREVVAQVFEKHGEGGGGGYGPRKPKTPFDLGVYAAKTDGWMFGSEQNVRESIVEDAGMSHIRDFHDLVDQWRHGWEETEQYGQTWRRELEKGVEGEGEEKMWTVLEREDEFWEGVIAGLSKRGIDVYAIAQKALGDQGGGGGYGPGQDERLWMRLGDASEYDEFDGLADAADMLSQLSEGQAFEPEDIRWHDDGMGLSLPGFEGQNYISLFWGDADAQPTRGLDDQDKIEFEDAVRTGER